LRNFLIKYKWVLIKLSFLFGLASLALRSFLIKYKWVLIKSGFSFNLTSYLVLYSFLIKPISYII